MDSKFNAYARLCTELNDRVAQLTTKAHIITTADPDKINWGHIGSMNHLLDRLNDAAEDARQLAAIMKDLTA